jgi:hypothetical protein
MVLVFVLAATPAFAQEKPAEKAAEKAAKK